MVPSRTFSIFRAFRNVHSPRPRERWQRYLKHFVEGIQQGLRELGYVEGQNIIIEYRFADGGTAELADLGSELLRLNVDLIVASATPAALAAKNLTLTVPIVMAGTLDPVDSGLVSGLSRPGSNVTGISFMSIDLATKRVELLKEITPQLSRLAVLGNLAHPSYASQIRAVEAGARLLSVQVEAIGVRGPNDFEAGFREARRAEALIQLDDVLFTSHRRSLVELAVANRLPAIYGFREHVDAGGLISFGTNFRELYVQTAHFVDKIIKGRQALRPPSRASDQIRARDQPEDCEGARPHHPPTLLARADEVIE
jgi:putative ABC transport system substrate-binding protein